MDRQYEGDSQIGDLKLYQMVNFQPSACQYEQMAVVA